jgi:hypothetical protein
MDYDAPYLPISHNISFLPWYFSSEKMKQMKMTMVILYSFLYLLIPRYDWHIRLASLVKAY